MPVIMCHEAPFTNPKFIPDIVVDIDSEADVKLQIAKTLYHVHYAASKSGILAMNKTLARTGAPYNITVNSIAPGVIFTDFTKAVHTDDEVAALESSIPLGLGKVEDVAAAAVYLASDEARYITGATIDVNGGSHIH